MLFFCSYVLRRSKTTTNLFLGKMQLIGTAGFCKQNFLAKYFWLRIENCRTWRSFEPIFCNFCNFLDQDDTLIAFFENQKLKTSTISSKIVFYLLGKLKLWPILLKYLLISENRSKSREGLVWPSIVKNKLNNIGYNIKNCTFQILEEHNVYYNLCIIYLYISHIIFEAEIEGSKQVTWRNLNQNRKVPQKFRSLL